MQHGRRPEPSVRHAVGHRAADQDTMRRLRAERCREVAAAGLEQQVPGKDHPGDRVGHRGSRAGRERDAMAQHRPLAALVEEDDHRTGRVGRNGRDADPLPFELPAQEHAAGVVAERADQPDLDAAAGESNRQVGALPSRADANLGGHVRAGTKASLRGGRIHPAARRR